MITLELLQRVCSDCPVNQLIFFADPLQAACAAAEIDSKSRVAAFLAQAAEESNQLRTLEENLTYTHAERIVAVFRRFGGDLEAAQPYVRNPQALASFVYAGVNGNGDQASGDGWRYRGRGIFQLTGRANYRACSLAVAGDSDTLLLNPDLGATPSYACDSAAWYWTSHGLNELADRGDFEGITRRINGGLNGLRERTAFLYRATQALE